mgnify:CR=1 FL=1
MKSSRKHLFLLLTVIALIVVNAFAPVFAAPPENYRVEFYGDGVLYTCDELEPGTMLPEAPIILSTYFPLSRSGLFLRRKFPAGGYFWIAIRIMR